MDYIKITVDQNSPKEAFRNIVGMNNSPKITIGAMTDVECELFNKINPGRTRHHDAALENPGYALIDVSRIFPLFHADESDPRNYCFKPTDFYLKQIADSGTEIEFRLGESIEHSTERYLVLPPPDFEKWARICLNIIRHYNEGWADGLHLGIKYWSIWEEPDNFRLFDGPFEKYLELYTIVAKAIKKEFPNLLVGGPNTMGVTDKTEQFFSHCRDTESPVDFTAFTDYSREPEHLISKVNKLKALADKYGFVDTEICVSEFHYGPTSWDYKDTNKYESFKTVESAAYTTYVISKLYDSPLSCAFYYGWACSIWGLNAIGTRTLLPIGDALIYLGDMSHCTSRLIPTVEGSCDDCTFLCGETENGNVKILASFFKAHNAEMAFTVPGKTKCYVRKISNNTAASQAIKTIDIIDDKFYAYFEEGGCGVFLFDFE